MSKYIPHEVKKYQNELSESPQFTRHKHHVFIMTPAARPLFVRYGDEVNISTLLSALASIMDKYKLYFSEDNKNSCLQQITHKNKKIMFIFRGYLYYICII